MKTSPPSASTMPLFVTLSFIAAFDGTTATLPSPVKSSVTSSAAARTAAPFLATMTPSLTTSLPRSATAPASAARSVPRLMTLPSFGVPTKAYLPAMKSAFVMFIVEAAIAPASTCAPGAKRTPAGLTRKTRPFAESVPKISEALPPSTRFKSAACAFGWKILTRSFAAILKLCQLMTAFCVA